MTEQAEDRPWLVTRSWFVEAPSAMEALRLARNMGQAYAARATALPEAYRHVGPPTYDITLRPPGELP